jgi:transposase
MSKKEAELLNEIEKLKASFLSFQKKIEELTTENQRLEELNRYLKLLKFGVKKDKVADGQMSILDELEMLKTIDELTEKIEIKSHTREIKKSKNLVNDDHNLPVEIIEHDIEDKNCPKCNSELTRMGYDVRKELCLRPAEMYIKEHRYFKYVCNNCEANDVNTPIIIAERENVPFPNTMASSSLVSQIIVDKYAKAVPLYRQEQFYNQNNINLSRQDMVNYIFKACELLKPLYEHLKKTILANDIVHADETPLLVVNKDGKITTNKSYMWIYTSGRSDPLIYLYEYCKTRSGDYPYQFLNKFEGYLLTDGYQGYNKIVKSTSKIIQVCCFAHARRRFSDVIKVSEGKSSINYSLGSKGLEYIDGLFHLEHQYESKQYDFNQIYEARLKEQKPILDEFYKWLTEYSLKVTPKSKLGEAINYTLDYWDELCNYLKDGRLELTNNRAERAVKPFVTGRKNWLFANTEKGAEASAILYSIVQTALYNNIAVYSYIDYLLTIIPNTKLNQFDDLLPWSDKLPNNIRRPLKLD